MRPSDLRVTVRVASPGTVISTLTLCAICWPRLLAWNTSPVIVTCTSTAPSGMVRSWQVVSGKRQSGDAAVGQRCQRTSGRRLCVRRQRRSASPKLGTRARARTAYLPTAGDGGSGILMPLRSTGRRMQGSRPGVRPCRDATRRGRGLLGNHFPARLTAPGSSPGPRQSLGAGRCRCSPPGPSPRGSRCRAPPGV